MNASTSITLVIMCSPVSVLDLRVRTILEGSGDLGQQVLRFFFLRGVTGALRIGDN